MEDLGVEVAEVGHDEDEDGLDDAHLVREAGNQPRGEAPDDADDRAADRHHEEGREARQQIRGQDVTGAHLCVRLEHVVQHLEQWNSHRRLLEQQNLTPPLPLLEALPEKAGLLPSGEVGPTLNTILRR